ncbi:MAG: N-acetyltransferase [Tunicatimonas sp.]
MNVVEVETGKRIKASILPLNGGGRKLPKSLFAFDWTREDLYEVYNLQIVATEELVGLVSAIDFPEEYRIHINLLEVSRENVGSKKQYRNIAGCLLAYCCRLSFERGYDGFVSLIPKTQLVRHYQEKYGFEQFGRQLAVYSTTSEHLIQRYL